MLEQLASVFRSTLVPVCLVNGCLADRVLQTTALEIEEVKEAAIYVVRNPDKLRHLNG